MLFIYIMLSKWTTGEKLTTMKPETNIIKDLKKNIKDLIPISALTIRFYPGPRSRPTESLDFMAHVSFKDLRFKLGGAIAAQQGLPAFKEKISRIRMAADQDERLVPIIVSPYLSPEKRKRCVDAGIYFLDLSGNVFLEYESLYIERLGFPNRFPEKRRGRGPFSDKASLILRAILSEKDKSWGIREMAQWVGLDPGFVSRMARELENRGYVTRENSKIILRDPRGILDDWIREYTYRRNRESSYFCPVQSPDEIIDKIRAIKIPDGVEYALSLHAGASLVAPYAVFNEVHLYLSDRKQTDFFIKLLNLKEVSHGANIIFLRPYYRNSVFYGRREINGLQVVSDIQLFLDLYGYPIRGVEQAEHLYEKRLKQLFEKPI